MSEDKKNKFSQARFITIWLQLRKTDNLHIEQKLPSPNTKYKHLYDYYIYDKNTKELLLSIKKNRERSFGYCVKNGKDEVLFENNWRASKLAKQALVSYNKQEDNIQHKMSKLLEKFVLRKALGK